MVAVHSNMFPLGKQAPDFKLLEVTSGQFKSLNELKSDKATVIMFICNHCPYVKHINEELVRLYSDYASRGISFIAISSNDVEKYPDDSPEQMKLTASAVGYSFPYLYDETQAVARAYEAACTPDFYIFDGQLACVYRGQLDDSRPKNDSVVTGKDLRAALDQLLAGQAVNPDQRPSIGCNIKWKES
jgi:thiol-disulfide isomerase/thioredoxin